MLSQPAAVETLETESAWLAVGQTIVFRGLPVCAAGASSFLTLISRVLTCMLRGEPIRCPTRNR